MAKCDFKLESHKAKWTAKPVFTFIYAETEEQQTEPSVLDSVSCVRASKMIFKKNHR